MKNLIDPINPGEVLLEDFLKPLGLSDLQLETEIGVDPDILQKTIAREGNITKEIAHTLIRQ